LQGKEQKRDEIFAVAYQIMYSWKPGGTGGRHNTDIDWQPADEEKAYFWGGVGHFG